MTDSNTITRTEFIDDNENEINERVVGYDENNHKVKESFDEDENGAFEKVLTFDTDGNTIREEYDKNGDGTLETVYTYDAEGNILSETVDFEDDGEIDVVRSYTRDEEGRVLTKSYDYGADGSTDVIKTTAYDENGDITLHTKDFDGDGNAEFRETITRTEEKEQSSITYAYSYDGDETAEVSSIETYDSSEGMRLTAYDYDGDGKVDHMIGEGGEGLYAEAYYDDDDDENISRITIVDNTGYQSQTITYDYDGDNDSDRIVNSTQAYNSNSYTTEYNYDGDKDIDRRETVIYGPSKYFRVSEIDLSSEQIKLEQIKIVDGINISDIKEDDDCEEQHRKGEEHASDYDNYDYEDYESMYGPGNPEIVMYDHDLHDDTLDRVVEYEYDDAGNIIKESHYYNERSADWDPDNSDIQSQRLDSEAYVANQVFTYDAKGNLLSETYDNDDDGDVDEARTYDAEGNLLSEETDFSDGGEPDGKKTFRSDGSLESQSYDRDDDGNDDQLYKYDSNENLIEMQADTDGDGKLDYTRRYSNNGNLTQETRDTDGDEKIDVQLDYDADGNLVREAYDVDADGVLDEYTTYEYVEADDTLDRLADIDELTGQRRVLSDAHDDSGDGIADHFETYEYDENGNVSQKVDAYDYDNDSRMDETYTSTYDKAGNILVYTEDKTGDGQANYIETYTYDANGKNLTYIEDQNGDGKAEYTETFTYDDEGYFSDEPRTIAIDHNGDGKVDEYYNNGGILTPSEDNQLLEVTSLGKMADTLTLDALDINVDELSDVFIFSVDDITGERTQIGNFSILPDDNVASAFALSNTLQGVDLHPGETLQFEMVQNGNSSIATVTDDKNDQAIVDFGNGTRFSAFLAMVQNNGTNVLVNDAEALNLEDFEGTADATFTVYREAAFDNTVGFYKMENAEGGVLAEDGMTVLVPGDEGYKAAATAQANRLAVNLTGQNNRTTTFEAQITSQFVGTFLIADGSDPNGNVYFGHAAANSGQLDHVKRLANNIFGFEDTAGLGDRDFNDIIVSIQLESLR